jgi:hypothetical protein
MSFLSVGSDLVSFAALTGGTAQGDAVGYIIKNYLPNDNKVATTKKLMEVVSLAFKLNAKPPHMILSRNVAANGDLLFPRVPVTNLFRANSGRPTGPEKGFGMMLPPPYGGGQEELVKVTLTFLCSIYHKNH